MSAQILSVKYNENNVPYIGLGEYEIRLESEQPSDAVMEKARTELRELPEIVEPAIAELRELLKGKKRAFISNRSFFHSIRRVSLGHDILFRSCFGVAPLKIITEQIGLLSKLVTFSANVYNLMTSHSK